MTHREQKVAGFSKSVFHSLTLFLLRFILNYGNTVATKGDVQRKHKCVMFVAFDSRQIRM